MYQSNRPSSCYRKASIRGGWHGMKQNGCWDKMRAEIGVAACYQGGQLPKKKQHIVPGSIVEQRRFHYTVKTVKMNDVVD